MVLGDDIKPRLMGMSGLDHILLQADPLYTGYPVPSQHILSYRREGDDVSSALYFLYSGSPIEPSKSTTGMRLCCIPLRKVSDKVIQRAVITKMQNK